MSKKLFKLPILPPLLIGYDVPAPVIIPPGSDPSLLNPNPYDNQVLETSTLMDIDPCVVVASWTESVTKRVDLTADEHAGVSLSEPTTMVFTASDPFLNSEVVAPQAVNDVTCNSEKSFKIHMEENKHVNNTNDVTCNSEKSFKKHMEEPIKLNNTQMLTASSTINRESEKKTNRDLENVTRIVSTVIEQEIPPSAVKSTLDEVSEKKKHDLSQKEAAGKSLLACDYPKSLFVCDIPELGSCYPKIATVEVDESLLKNPTSVEPSNSGTTNRPTKLNVHQTNWCDICKVSCGDMSLHIAGEQHQKNLIVSEKTPIPPRTTIVTSRDTTSITKSMEEPKPKPLNGNDKTTWCELCKITCATKLYNIHVAGRKHIKNLQKLEKIPNSPSTVIDTVMTEPLVEKLKLTRGEVVNPNEGNSSGCELCGVYCATRDMLNEHILGKKHQKNLKKTARVPKTPDEPMNEEGEIVLLEGSKRKANDALNKEDEDTKRQKVNEEEEACGVLVICKVCNVGFDGLIAFKTHLAGIEHSAMLLKQAKGGSNGLQV